jgi:hypothetical protein
MKDNRTSPPRRSRPLRRLGWSAAAGLAAAVALTVFVGTVRHAALVKSAARPAANGQKLSPDFILACGFTATFVIVTAAVFIAVTVAAYRRGRRWEAESGAAYRRAAGWQY